MTRTPIVVLGAGPAGLAAAFRLSNRQGFDVTVIERTNRVGGNAGSFVIDGIPVDFGSHRLHPSCAPPILADIRALIGDDLLDRPRVGRIRLRGRWVHFPLKPLDLALHLPPDFLAGVVSDAVRRRAVSDSEPASFASVLEAGLGRTICQSFYFPYAEKIWGLPADALDAEQARRRVKSGSIARIVGRIARQLPGFKRNGAGRFFYPKGGFGQISDAMAAAATKQGTTLMLNTEVSEIVVRDGRATSVEVTTGGERRTLAAHHVLSTVPLTTLSRLVRGASAAPAIATGTLQHRAMVLVYLLLGADRLTEFDAHYFPETATRISRLSEPKNYSQTTRPGRTVLCAELPCARTDAEWTMAPGALQAIVTGDLERAGLGPVPPVLSTHVERLPAAYPIYTRNFRNAFDQLDVWSRQIDGLVTFGRQGLFAHDNTHHAMAMAYAVADCIDDGGGFDTAQWARARVGFEQHVVED